jgi:hypothetical protein
MAIFRFPFWVRSQLLLEPLIQHRQYRTSTSTSTSAGQKSLKKLHVGACAREFLRQKTTNWRVCGCKVWKFLVPPHLLIEILVFDMFFDNLDVRDHYGDVGHHILVQDAHRFIQKYMISIHGCLFFVFVYISRTYSLFIDFHGPSRVFSCTPRRPPRKISTDSSDLEFIYHNLMPFIYGQRFLLLDKRQFLHPGIPHEGVQPGYLWPAYGRPMVSSVPYVSMPDP